MIKKSLIALALATLGTAAFAQSNVTIYGVADVGYMYAKGNPETGVSGTNSFSGLASGGWSGSRLGFKGEEDLGNGLKAIFQFEYGMNIQQNEAMGALNRQAFVGLDSKYGTFTAGRQYAPSYLIMGRNSANEITGNNPMNQMVGGNGAIPTLGGTMATNSNSRWNNSVAFQSKTYGGVSGRAIYSFGESGYNGNVTGGDPTVSTGDNGKLGIGLSYVNGPLNIDGIWQGQRNVRTTYLGATAVGQGSDINEFYVGAGYDFNVVKVVGSYQNLKNKNTNLSFNRADAYVWSLGAIVPVSAAGKVRMEYAQVAFNQADNTGVPSEFQLDGRSKGFSVGYTHDLSKRTMLYTSIAHMTNDGNSLGLGTGAVGSGAGDNVGASGQSNNSFLAGVKHSF